MTIEETVKWYYENTGIEIPEKLIQRFIDNGIIDNNINVDKLNLYILDLYDGKFVKENGKFKIRTNVLSTFSNFIEKNSAKTNNNTNKFKIEKISGNRLKLVKK